MNAELKRLQETEKKLKDWRLWGPYVSDRQWGTVREDYSEYGTAWDYVPFDKAKSYAYRWGEDGIAGICDKDQVLCFSFAFWNGNDRELKERLFGLSGPQGNHGEDVKEIYFYKDNLPTHAYMAMSYKYPINAFPYEKLLELNKTSKSDPELELFETGVFKDNNYFDILIEYAKEEVDYISIKITIKNESLNAAKFYLIPQLYFRNTWSWDKESQKPKFSLSDQSSIKCDSSIGTYYFNFFDQEKPLFCDNERNGSVLYNLSAEGLYFKDGVNDYVVLSKKDAVNPKNEGTKVGVLNVIELKSNEEKSFTFSLSKNSNKKNKNEIENLFSLRKKEADEFYKNIHKGKLNDEDALIQRQAFSGLLWSKQFYHFDLNKWIEGDPSYPKPPESRKHGRNSSWKHLYNKDIISMPDKWEYPWYAAWDLAFHCVPFAVIDPDFAKKQLVLMTREWYMHPNGQLPAYEWAFGDVNPPVHAWAAWRVFQIERKMKGGDGDLRFLERILHKMMINFTWWVNRKDIDGRNIFQGGFLGLDNIGVFDRSAPLPTGGHINQADGTSWMAMFALNLMRISLELAKHNSIYEDIASKFFEHFLYIAQAMTNMADEGIGLWDEKDQFFYDVLTLPNGNHEVLRLRSMVGLIPLFAVETLEPELLERLPNFNRRLNWVLNNRPDLASLVSHWDIPGKGQRRLLSLLRGHRMKKILSRMLDEKEFLSPYGIRALSKVYETNPFEFNYGETKVSVSYQAAESNTIMFGGNSNWRGPVWFPVNYLIVESLQKFYHYYGEDFKIESPTGSGKFVSILEVSQDISSRLCGIFRKDSLGDRPVYSRMSEEERKLNKDNILFYEYFHPEKGAGIGASHQTGWTALVAKLLMPRFDE